MTVLKLTGKARAALLDLIAHTTDTRVLRRAYAVAWLDDGESVPDVAEQLNVSRQSVYNWLERFIARHDLPLTRRLSDAARSGRPVTVQGIIDSMLDAIIDTDPRALVKTDHRKGWMIRLGVQVKDIFHTPDELGTDRRNTPFTAEPRLEIVFLSVRRTVSSDRS
ncbi:hypothetical protein TFLX_00895 [Thermoflexales bacterium]|nr:hypothetical protein TFLX_00895 [Thermoflexales bacterium]